MRLLFNIWSKIKMVVLQPTSCLGGEGLQQKDKQEARWSLLPNTGKFNESTEPKLNNREEGGGWRQTNKPIKREHRYKTETRRETAYFSLRTKREG